LLQHPYYFTSAVVAVAVVVAAAVVVRLFQTSCDFPILPVVGVAPAQLRCCLLCCQSHLKSVVQRDHETLVLLDIGGSTTFVHSGDFKLVKICEFSLLQ